MERFVFFLNQHSAHGDVMAESRGGKEDLRLKGSFARMWSNGTEYVEPRQFQNALTSKELKVKQKMNNISGLQLADLVAHPSRDEILKEQELLEKELGVFGKKVIRILQHKYYKHDGRTFGKKFL
jgi:pantoate kinase